MSSGYCRDGGAAYLQGCTQFTTKPFTRIFVPKTRSNLLSSAKGLRKPSLSKSYLCRQVARKPQHQFFFLPTGRNSNYQKLCPRAKPAVAHTVEPRLGILTLSCPKKPHVHSNILPMPTGTTMSIPGVFHSLLITIKSETGKG